MVNHWRKDASLWVVLEHEGCIPGKLEQAIAEAGQIMHRRFDVIRPKPKGAAPGRAEGRGPGPSRQGGGK